MNQRRATVRSKPVRENAPCERAAWIVLDGVGAGALPDAGAYGDAGANTLGNLSRALAASGRMLRLPALQRCGLGNVTAIAGVPPLRAREGCGAYGTALEQSAGKDSTVGHWELAGVIVRDAFATYPRGFPADTVAAWAAENDLPGVLGNCPASGTEIMAQLGEEHVRSGRPILYTSADSVWQVAAHEEHFGLERLYAVCHSARRYADALRVARVIARPFRGDPAGGVPFARTAGRKDISVVPPAPTVLGALQDAGVATLGIGKIGNLFADQGLDENLDTRDNAQGLAVLRGLLAERRPGLLFCNLVDFDMSYGHRRDVRGFADALEAFDAALAELVEMLDDTTLLLITADHGNDPTHHGTDHTREYAPVLAVTGTRVGGGQWLGVRQTFGDVGATVFEALTGSIRPAHLAGRSFLGAIQPPAARVAASGAPVARRCG
ncbi:MAG: phosphopentomutase [Candidatus Binatia bacterium]